ncbi:signal transduction histidine kinase [Isoptericola jiangsuensis]|uniref:histidine kinase n=1 Tax=Isoptericola jiangsuensis TaxID=548579 RepID=A0A2A9EU07_9MICO|nr:histidine kinase [Isoptericola jiangsuensis]PFG41752.1 signal transduction histidine kinase [Isoptericola jiangsuensis]
MHQDTAGTGSRWRRWSDDGPRRDLVDAVVILALGALLLAVGLVDVTPDDLRPLGAPPAGGHLVLLAVGCVLVALKRRAPLVALAAGTALVVLDLAWGGSLALLLVGWDLLFAATLWVSPRARTVLWTLAGTVCVVGAVLAAEATRDLRVLVYAAIQLGALLLVPMWWADNVRQKTALADAERERAEAAARTAALERRRAADAARLAAADRHEAVQAERAAMARDLHDVIAGHLSTIAIHAGGALAARPDPVRDRGALEQVRVSAVESLTEMRAMIELLRADAPAEPVTAPGRLAGLHRLVAQAAGAGADVALDVDPGALDPPSSAAVEQAVHRIAQEALTNAAKHAPGQPVAVRLDAPDGGLVLRVRNPLAPGPVPPADPLLRAGTGLVTMAERAEALGGSFRAGPRDGTWHVRAALPRPAAADARTVPGGEDVRPARPAEDHA